MRNSPRALLVLLTTLNFVNYLDRYEMAAVLETVRTDLHLSNLQAGLLGTVFLTSFLVTAPIFGVLGDRMKRKHLLLFGAIVWSVATIASGLASSAAMLFAARAMVGVGEASFTTLAPTVIDDVAPEERRTRWLAIFHIAAPVGSALGYIVGGFVAQHWGWHSAFFVGGLPGLILGVMVAAAHEPERRISDNPPQAGTLLETARTLFGLRDYRFTVLGYTAQTFAVGAFAFWAPAFLLKRFGASLAKANFTFGLVTVVAGLLATLCGGWLGDRRQNAAEAAVRARAETPDAKPYREDQRRADALEKAVQEARNKALLRVSATAALPAAGLALLCFLAPNQPAFFVLAFLTEFGVFFSNAPINAALLRTVPPELRSRAMAYAIFSIHAFGDLWSPALIGLLADGFGDARIQFAMMPLPVAFGAAAVCWWIGATGRKSSESS